ncbi:MAG TPA: PQQ-binding-like beta-propeller repeat protein, partial [Solirubrobacteraceae bacterium]|nr:PQQ-binding-like beta-propeller repeat protein [Solirubrobacteraceae bacterium]
MRRLAVLLLLAVLALAPAGAQAADETTQYLMNTSHTSSVPDSPLQPPLKLRWRADLGSVASNVLATGGRIFYVREPGTGAQLTALSSADGSQLWSQPVTAGSTIAADGGKLFVVGDSSTDYPYSVLVRALDPATGNQIWSRTIESEYGAGSHPTAADGQLFLLAASGASSLYALRQSDGQNLWPPKSLTSGDGSAPTLDGDTVYVSLPAHRTYAFRRSDGTERWQSKGCCTGGGGTTSVLHNGRLYGEGGLIHQTSDGLIVGEWRAYPVWAGDAGVVREDSALRGIGPDYGTTRWTTTLPSSYDGNSLPMIAGQHVYTGSGNDLRAHRLGDAGEAWCVRPELPPGSGSSSSSSVSVAPVAAGDGLLLVSAGYGLAAYENGGPASTCTTGSPPPDGTTGSPPPLLVSRPALDLHVGRTDLFLGERTRVEGQVRGMPITAGQEVVAEVDLWPFDGVFVAGARDRAGDGGFVAYTLRPIRNVQVRLRLASDQSVVSQPTTVWVDFASTIVRRGGGGPRPRVRATLFAPREAEI